MQDPDGNLWEFYLLESDIANRGEGSVPIVGQSDSRARINGAGRKSISPFRLRISLAR